MDKLLVFKIAHPCQILFKEMSMPKICQMSAKNQIKYLSKMPSNIRQWNHFNIFLTKPAAISLHHCSSWMKVGTVLFPGQSIFSIFSWASIFVNFEESNGTSSKSSWNLKWKSRNKIFTSDQLPCSLLEALQMFF